MRQINKGKDKPVTLKAGNCIFLQFRHQCLRLFETPDLQGTIYWADDDKMPADFIRSESDFISLVIILAETHGLRTKRMQRNEHGLWFEFI